MGKAGEEPCPLAKKEGTTGGKLSVRKGLENNVQTKPWIHNGSNLVS